MIRHTEQDESEWEEEEEEEPEVADEKDQVSFLFGI